MSEPTLVELHEVVRDALYDAGNASQMWDALAGAVVSMLAEAEQRGAEQRQAEIVKALLSHGHRSDPFTGQRIEGPYDAADFIDSLPTVEEEPG